jgi:hypothetical protein
MARAGGLAPTSAPFVLTLELDGESFAFFDGLRRRHYPPERNLVPAHVTLFHRLPGERSREIRALLRQAAATQKPFHLAMGAVKATDRGVIILLHATRLVALRHALAAEWWAWLSDQDRMHFQPHVTIQGGVSAAEARQTQRSVTEASHAPAIRALGLHLWRYREGRWESAELFAFRR